jgi:hypothetical protein
MQRVGDNQLDPNMGRQEVNALSTTIVCSYMSSILSNLLVHDIALESKANMQHQRDRWPHHCSTCNCKQAASIGGQKQIAITRDAAD